MIGLIIGLFLLVFALLARIIHGIRTKQGDAVTGGLSITVILSLLGIIVAVGLVGYVMFSLLHAFGIS